MAIGSNLSTDLGLELVAQGKAEGETYNVAGMEVVHRPTMHALKDALIFLGSPSYKDKFTSLPSDITIDELSIRILNTSRYIPNEPILPQPQMPEEGVPTLFGMRVAGSDQKVKIANQVLDSEYKKGRYYPFEAQFISRPFSAGDNYSFLYIQIDGYIPTPETGQFSFEEKSKRFTYELLDGNFAPLAYGDNFKGLIHTCIPKETKNIRYKINFPMLGKPPLLDTPVLDSVMIVLLRKIPQPIFIAEVAETD